MLDIIFIVNKHILDNKKQKKISKILEGSKYKRGMKKVKIGLLLNKVFYDKRKRVQI